MKRKSKEAAPYLQLSAIGLVISQNDEIKLIAQLVPKITHPLYWKNISFKHELWYSML